MLDPAAKQKGSRKSLLLGYGRNKNMLGVGALSLALVFFVVISDKDTMPTLSYQAMSFAASSDEKLSHDEYEKVLKDAKALLAAAAAAASNPLLRGAQKAEIPSSWSSVNSRDMPKDLVIGMAKDLLEEQLAIFAGSLREWSTKEWCNIVIFLNEPVAPRVQTLMKKLDVISIPFQEDQLLPTQLRSFHPSTYRWPLIYEYLRQYPHQYKRVIMADVRDTAFQQNPFETIFSTIDSQPPAALYTFHGVESRTIGECGWNGGWIRDCFGADVLQNLFKDPIICSGISAGTIVEVQTYVKLMTKSILSPEFMACERNGVDQGVHNVLVHTRQIPHQVVLSQSEGPVCNLQAGVGRVIEPEFKVVAPGDGQRLYAIVHQYDRNKALTKHYMGKYKPLMVLKEEQQQQAGGEGSGGKTEACSEYQLWQGQDLFKGKCDIEATGAIDVEACCGLCSDRRASLPFCSSFTFYGSLCYMKSCQRIDDGSKLRLDGATSGMMREYSVPGTA